MPALHDMTCLACGAGELDARLSREGKPCKKCRAGRMEILWQAYHRRDAAVHSKERTALYYSAKERKWQYPATNDKPIPDRLVKRGYERVEFSSLRAVEQHERQTGTRSHMAWWDRGSGRSPDGD
mgnify:CR=1 FL=1